MNPEFSIIVTNHSGNAPFFQEAIDSLKEQTYKNFEVIIVTSSDVEQTNFGALNYKIYKVEEKKEKYEIGLKRNIGLDVAKGEFQKFLDSDDLLYPDYLKFCKKYFNEFPDIDLVYTDFFINKDKILTSIKTEDFDIQKFLVTNLINMSSAAFRRNYLRQNEDLDTWEDYEFWLRLIRNHKAMRIPFYLMERREHLGQVSKNLRNVEFSIREIENTKNKLKKLRLFILVPFLPLDGPASWLSSLIRELINYNIKIVVYVTSQKYPGEMAEELSTIVQIIYDKNLKEEILLFAPDTILFWGIDPTPYFSDLDTRIVRVHHGEVYQEIVKDEKVICLHEYLKEKIQNKKMEDIKVISPSPFIRSPDEDLRKKLNINPYIVGFLGRLVPEKNIFNLAAAVTKSHWTLLIAGEGPEKDRIKKEIGDNEKIKFIGNIKNPTNVLVASDLICLPSKVEGFSFVTQEAAMMEIPMLLTKVGASPYIFGDDSVFWTDGSINDIAEKLNKISLNYMTEAKIKAKKAKEKIYQICNRKKFVEDTLKFCFPSRYELVMI